jgi:putative Holliday junction resolvase
LKLIVQQKEIPNTRKVTDSHQIPLAGRLICIDPGTKRIGVAISDDLQITTRGLDVLTRSSWKKFLQAIKNIVSDFDAKAVIIGLPLESDGSESEMSAYARDIARKFSLSLGVPVFLQDERVSSYEAKGRLWAAGRSLEETRKLVDSEAAAIILSDFIEHHRNIT